MRASAFAVVFGLAAAAAGCASEAREVSRPHVVTAQGAAVIAQSERDAQTHWEQRAREADVRAAIAAWSRVAAMRPDDVAVATALARASFFLAEDHLVFRKDKDADARAEYVAALDAGVAAADAGLRAHWPAFGEKRRLGVPFVDAVALVADDREAAPLLYWWAQCRMFAANARGLGATIAAHQEVFRVMELVAALDPAYWYGGADRYLGVVYAAAPAVAGGDTELSREHFAAALAHGPGFLETRLLYAHFHRDRAVLEAVARGDGADDDPAIAPEQAVARRKAGMLLAALSAR